jgi:hypothetical protein
LIVESRYDLALAFGAEFTACGIAVTKRLTTGFGLIHRRAYSSESSLPGAANVELRLDLKVGTRNRDLRFCRTVSQKPHAPKSCLKPDGRDGADAV